MMVQDQQLAALLEALVQDQALYEHSIFLPLFDRLEEMGDSRLEAIRELANLECPGVNADDWPDDPDGLDWDDDDGIEIETDLLVGKWWFFQLVRINADDVQLYLQLHPHAPLATRIVEQKPPGWQSNGGPENWPVGWGKDAADDEEAPWLSDDVPYGETAYLEESFERLRRQLIHAYLTLMPA